MAGTDPFRFSGAWTFPVSPAELWQVLTSIEDYPRWWPWLRFLDGDGFVPGGRSVCAIRAPVPYTLRFTVTVEELDPGRLMVAQVDGDLAGPARITVGEAEAGRSTAQLQWEVELRRPALRAAARVGRPLMVWGHDQIVQNGLRQFCERALRVDAPT